MRFLASPRRRRRLAWVVLAGGVVGLFLLVNALLANRSPSKQIQVAPHAPVVGGGRPTTTSSFGAEDPAAERARVRAEAAVHPLANAFVGDLLRRRRLRDAYALLAPSLRAHFSLADWQRGRNLPLSANVYATPGSTVAFSGRTTVGLVASIAPGGSAPAGSDSTLFAVRFEKTNGRWRSSTTCTGATARAASTPRTTRPRASCRARTGKPCGPGSSSRGDCWP
ncbi:MAG: hypothetical protein M3P41_04245 [Actinomycetota bacterium]|nr:hypothetical protein [Actinomycetota bacterium]